MNFSNEQLMAYVDGECSAEERAAIEAAIAQDPALAKQVMQQQTQQQALRRRLSAAFAPVLSEPVPLRLLETLESVETPQDNVVALKPRSKPSGAWQWPQWTALAATLLIGVLAGLYGSRPDQDTSLVSVTATGLVTRGSLSKALGTQLASTQTNDAAVRMGISFKDRDGHYCRTFVATKQSLAGLACNVEQAWQLRVLSATDAARGGDNSFRQAGSTLPQAVLSAVDQAISGEPLDAAAEEQAFKAGWR